MSKIFELTAHQMNLVTAYREKWIKIAFFTQTIELQKASLVVEKIYKKLLSSEEFEILLLESPLAVANLSFLSVIQPNVDLCNPKKLSNLIRKVERQLIKSFLGDKFPRSIVYPLIEQVGSQLDIRLWNDLRKQFYIRPPLNHVFSGLRDSFKASPVWQAAKPNQKDRLEGLWRYLATGLVRSDYYPDLCGLFDFCVSELECSIEEELWNILTTFVTECGWTFFFQDFCFLCNRPCRILRDDENAPHLENQPTIQFIDGFSIFAHDGEG